MVNKRVLSAFILFQEDLSAPFSVLQRPKNGSRSEKVIVHDLFDKNFVSYSEYFYDR